MSLTQRLLGFWASLSDCNQPRGRYLARALMADLPVTLAVALVINWLTHESWPTFEGYSLWRVFFAMGLVAPLGETLLMALIIWVIRPVVKRVEYLPFISALIWAVMHSLARISWGPGIFWAFVIFSTCYVTWHKKSVWQAIGMTALLHSLHNLFPLLLLLVTRKPA